jgi:hypothetical protein
VWSVAGWFADREFWCGSFDLDGKTRSPRIPTVKDRLVQAAALRTVSAWVDANGLTPITIFRADAPDG